MMPKPDVSVVLVSFNTCALTRECLAALRVECEGLNAEILIVDNASTDGSAEMIAAEFPEMTLLRSDVNLGFGNANNLALAEAHGRYIVLLNTDAFLAAGSLRLAIRCMDAHPRCALGGGRLVGRDGSAQPSARMFHGLLNDASVMTGMATRWPRSRIFGRLDRTWADPMQASEVDWVPGAFSIVRPEALAEVGAFDPAFFLYYEEVDLCRRMKTAGWQVWYWPEIVVTHIGGESSRTMKSMSIASASAQVATWRMRSTLLYYRKHHGWKARAAAWLEGAIYAASEARNRLSRTPHRRERAQYFHAMRSMLRQAWRDTNGGRVSPRRPW